MSHGPQLIVHVALESGELKTGGEALLDLPGNKWIDVVAPSHDLMSRLQERFGLHRLAVEDCFHLDQRAKLEDYPKHLFVVLHALTHADGDVCEVQLNEVHSFLGSDWYISVHDRPLEVIEIARKRMLEAPAETLGRGADFALYLVADAIVDSGFPLLDQLTDEVENLEELIFEGPDPNQLRRIFQLKRTLVTLRRVLSPQRDLVGQLARAGIPHVRERTALYFRDVFDHLIRVYEQIEAARDLVSSAAEGYLSMVANRTNEVTKKLTIFAALFLPLSFIVGFFGQNFQSLSDPRFFGPMIVLLLLVPVVQYAWFRAKRWW